MDKIDLHGKIIGRFYFKKTQNNNLIGEFSNNLHNRNYTESADSICATENFIGEYYSTWQDNGKATFAKLKIEYKEGSGTSLFKLEWFSEKEEKIFEGEGFLCDDMLIGDYRDFEIGRT